MKIKFQPLLREKKKQKMMQRDEREKPLQPTKSPYHQHLNYPSIFPPSHLLSPPFITVLSFLLSLFFSPLACRIDCWVGDGYIAFFFTHFSNNYGKYDLWKVFQCWGSVTSLIFDFLTTPHLSTRRGDTSHNILVGQNPSQVTLSQTSTIIPDCFHD